MSERLRRLWEDARRYFLGVSVLILVCAASAHAQDSPDQSWIEKVPCREKEKRQSPYTAGGKYYIICYEFNDHELTPSPQGTRFVPLTITAYGPPGNPSLPIEGLDVADPRRQPGLIIGKPSDPNNMQTTLMSQTSYRYSIALDNQVKPEPYQMQLRIAGDRTPVYFDLPMGAPGGEWLEFTKESQKSLECWSGYPCSEVTLTFVNKLPYDLQISEVSANSEPGDLLQSNVAATPQQLRTGLSPQPVLVKLQAKPISIYRAFSGLKIPRALLNIRYNDTHGREFFKQVPLDLELRPNIMVLAVMLLLGAFAGTLLRIDLGRLQKAGYISRRQKLGWALATGGTGVLVCLIALFANLKVVVFADQSTYSTWDPRMLFLTSLIGTMGGIPILYALLRLPNKTDVPEEKKPAPDRAPQVAEGGQTP
jgi:hypothetical protein